MRRWLLPWMLLGCLAVSTTAAAQEASETKAPAMKDTPAGAANEGAAKPDVSIKAEATVPKPAIVKKGRSRGRWRRRVLADNDWRSRGRRGTRPSSGGLIESTHFVFELRFGPYSPNVDEEFGGRETPYADFFGSDALFYFGLEIDWLPLHIPYVGSFGAGFGWGFTSASGNARLKDDPTQTAGSETSLTIFPMHVSGIARIDGPLRKLGIPIVPYAKLGLGMASWSASGPNGTSQVDGVAAEGTSFGMHLALGAALALNVFDESSAIAMQQETGIRYAYFYGEWMRNNLGGAGEMHVGTSTVVLGIALDF